MDDVNLKQDLQRMLGQFRQAGAAIAGGADVGQVLDMFGQFDEGKARLRERRAGEVHPDSASIESIFVALEDTGDSVRMLQLHFKEAVTLGAVENELGGWYRDPPEPFEAAYTAAYFNPRLIDPRADFFVYAVIDEWCDRFTPYTLVNTLNIDFIERRRVTERPW